MGIILISKRDKALIYHQRILYSISTSDLSDASGPDVFRLLKLIAQNISKETKDISRVWAMDIINWAAGCVVREPKHYVIFWGE